MFSVQKILSETSQYDPNIKRVIAIELFCLVCKHSSTQTTDAWKGAITQRHTPENLVFQCSHCVGSTIMMPTMYVEWHSMSHKLPAEVIV